MKNTKTFVPALEVELYLCDGAEEVEVHEPGSQEAARHLVLEGVVPVHTNDDIIEENNTL
jgi:hypothetical protein